MYICIYVCMLVLNTDTTTTVTVHTQHTNWVLQITHKNVHIPWQLYSIPRKKLVPSSGCFFFFCPYKMQSLDSFFQQQSLVVFILPQGHNILSSSSSSSSLLSHGLGSSVYDILFFLSTECETSRSLNLWSECSLFSLILLQVDFFCCLVITTKSREESKKMREWHGLTLRESDQTSSCLWKRRKRTKNSKVHLCVNNK
jgi:hypothetical protein